MDRMLEQSRAVRQVAEQLAEAATVKVALLAIGAPESAGASAAAA